MLTIGRHLIAEYYDCDGSDLNSTENVRQILLDATASIGATVVGETFHKFAPQGVSGTVVIAESHLSVHTWPERGYVAVDIYTCGGLDPYPGFELIGERLGASSSRVQEIIRGLPDELESDRTIWPEDVTIITRQVEAKRAASSAVDPASG